MHIVYSTKDRRKLIPPDKKTRLWSYIGGICKHENIFVHAVGGMEDHIHLLLQIPPTIALAKAVLTVKTNSSRWMKEHVDDFAWQQGYGGIGRVHVQLPRVVRH